MIASLQILGLEEEIQQLAQQLQDQTALAAHLQAALTAATEEQNSSLAEPFLGLDMSKLQAAAITRLEEERDQLLADLATATAAAAAATTAASTAATTAEAEAGRSTIDLEGLRQQVAILEAANLAAAGAASAASATEAEGAAVASRAADLQSDVYEAQAAAAVAVLEASQAAEQAAVGEADVLRERLKSAVKKGKAIERDKQVSCRVTWCWRSAQCVFLRRIR